MAEDRLYYLAKQSSYMIHRSYSSRVYKTMRLPPFCGTLTRTTCTELIAHTEPVYDGLDNYFKARPLSFTGVSTSVL